jgi:hypothetical protein
MIPLVPDTLPNLSSKHVLIAAGLHDSIVPRYQTEDLFDLNALSVPNCMGFSHGELAKIVGVHRDTLRVYMGPLIRSGTVWRDQPKSGNYHISQKEFLKPRLAGKIMAENFLAKLFNKRLLKTRALFPKHLKVNFGGSMSTYTLFNFSRAIGDFVTFALIYAMNPDNPAILSKDSNIKRDKIAEEFIRSALSSLTPKILFRFKSLMADFGYISDKFTHYLDGDSFNKLLKDFIDVSPYLYIKLGENLESLPSRVRHEEEYLEYLQLERRKRHTCKHEYEAKHKRKSVQNILGDLESKERCINVDT